MKVKEVIRRAVAKKITWWQAAEIIGLSDRSLRRWRGRYSAAGRPVEEASGRTTKRGAGGAVIGWDANSSRPSGSFGQRSCGTSMKRRKRTDHVLTTQELKNP